MFKHFFRDEAPINEFLVNERIGEKRSKTPEGYLLCEDVPLARTGKMLYTPEEMQGQQDSESDGPLEPSPMNYYVAVREPEDVFNPDFLASINGKPVVHYHPDEDVTLDNWKNHVIGTVFNARRGTGEQADLIIGELLITTPEGIAAIEGGTREISLGYEARYTQITPGTVRQIPILTNHIALVDDGRCGSRCSIADRKPQGEIKMARVTDKRKVVRDHNWYNNLAERIRKAFNTKDAEGLDKALSEGEIADDELPANGGGDDVTHIHLHTGDADGPIAPGGDPGVTTSGVGGEDRTVGVWDSEEWKGHVAQNAAEHAQFRDDISALKAHLGIADDDQDPAVGEEMSGELPAAADRKTVMKDSAALSESFTEAVSGAEILAPGISLPVYDRKAPAKKTFDSICKLRRTALELAYATPAGRSIIDDLNGGRLALDGMKCGEVRTLFRGVVANKRRANKAGANSSINHDNGSATKQIRTVADLNESLKRHYGGK